MRSLEAVIAALPGAIVAYSGGADSAFLAEMANQVLGRRAMAVTADSPSLPRRELRAAAELARQRGWQHQIVETFELEDGRYAANPVDRCYFCKSALFDRLRPLSDSLGVPVCLGTNTDDLSEWRPGQRAASDRGARHPLVEAGLSKAAVREASRAIGLPCADKPAAACLASRFAYGVRVTKEGLGRIEFAEEALLGQGFSVVRVRDLGADRARVEVGREEVARLLDLEGLVRARLEGLGFAEVVLDERGYRPGALNEGLGLVAH